MTEQSEDILLEEGTDFKKSADVGLLELELALIPCVVALVTGV